MMTMTTYNGIRVNPTQPETKHINIHDIAQSLSNLCRFNGHCQQFYSVAQHSMLVAEMVPEELRLVALLHDATEAYLGDVITPVKQQVDGFQKLEIRLWKRIASAFDIQPELIELVHMADLMALATEKRDLMPQDTGEWPILKGIPPHEDRIIPMAPALARQLFMQAFYRYQRAYKSQSLSFDMEEWLFG